MTLRAGSLAGAVGVGAVALLGAAGCGGGGGDAASQASHATVKAPRAVVMDDAATRAAVRRARASERPAHGKQPRPAVSSHPTVAHGAHTKPDRNESTSGGAPNPCRLVSRGEAARIIGSRVLAPSEGLQGPTCLYRAPKLRQLVTVAVQPVDAAAASRARSTIRVTVRGHRSYCVKQGGLRLLVPLGPGSSLAISGPCPIDSGFAARALARLSR